MERLGIEFISVFGLPPVEFVHLAADLGCESISLGLAPLDCNPHGYPAYALSDEALQRDFVAARQERGVALALAEGFFIVPGRDVDASAADLDLMRRLGAERINALALDPELGRCIDQLGKLADMSAERGMGTTLEFVPGTPAGDLNAAVELVRKVGRPNLTLLVDTMHLARSGGTAEDLTALGPGIIGYAQLCDAPLARSDMSYGEEAKFERLPPGQGDLPLLEYLKALPRGLDIGLEIPQRRLAEAGLAPRERLGTCVEAARALLARRDAGAP